jgi:hypothetical protein
MTKSRSDLVVILNILDRFIAFEEDQLDKDIENDAYVQHPIDYTREKFLEARELIIKAWPLPTNRDHT